VNGTVKARAREWALGHSSNGNEQVAVLFEITQGEHAGRTITWFGFFTEHTWERTMDSLRHCGWDGNDFTSLDGLDANEVELVIEQEEYQGKVRDRVKWVNRPSRLALKEAMGADAMRSFAAKMRGRAQTHKAKYGAQPAATSPRAQSQRGHTQQQPSHDAMDPDPSGGYYGPPPAEDDIPF
jgi:hypothetical protein